MRRCFCNEAALLKLFEVPDLLLLLSLLSVLHVLRLRFFPRENKDEYHHRSAETILFKKVIITTKPSTENRYATVQFKRCRLGLSSINVIDIYGQQCVKPAE